MQLFLQHRESFFWCSFSCTKKIITFGELFELNLIFFSLHQSNKFDCIEIPSIKDKLSNCLKLKLMAKPINKFIRAACQSELLVIFFDLSLSKISNVSKFTCEHIHNLLYIFLNPLFVLFY